MACVQNCVWHITDAPLAQVQWMHEVCCACGWDLQESTCMKRGLPLLCCDCLRMRICFCRYIWGFTMGNRIWCLTQILVSSPTEVIAFWKEEVTIGEVYRGSDFSLCYSEHSNSPLVAKWQSVSPTGWAWVSCRKDIFPTFSEPAWYWLRKDSRRLLTTLVLQEFATESCMYLYW